METKTIRSWMIVFLCTVLILASDFILGKIIWGVDALLWLIISVLETFEQNKSQQEGTI